MRKISKGRGNPIFKCPNCCRTVYNDDAKDQLGKAGEYKKVDVKCTKCGVIRHFRKLTVN